MLLYTFGRTIFFVAILDKVSLSVVPELCCTLCFFLRRSKFGAEAERLLWLFCDLRLNTFLSHGIQGQLP